MDRDDSVREDDSVKRVWRLSHLMRQRSLKPGDHIYSRRFFYHHHGIYTGEPGENEVIHFTGKRKGDAEVKRTSLRTFLQGGLLYLATYGDPKAKKKIRGTSHGSPSLPADVVLKKAKEYADGLKSWGEYNIRDKNCENFAYACKTGQEFPPETPSSGIDSDPFEESGKTCREVDFCLSWRLQANSTPATTLFNTLRVKRTEHSGPD